MTDNDKQLWELYKILLHSLKGYHNKPAFEAALTQSQAALKVWIDRRKQS